MGKINIKDCNAAPGVQGGFGEPWM